VWIFVAVSQLRLRKAAERDGTAADLPVRMWGFPWLSWVALVAMAGVLILMWTDADARTQLFTSGAVAVLIVAISLLRRRPRR